MRVRMGAPPEEASMVLAENYSSELNIRVTVRVPDTRNLMVQAADCLYAVGNFCQFRRLPSAWAKGVDLNSARISRSLPVFFLVFPMVFLAAVPGWTQATLYDNGSDGNVGYYHVNFGAAVSNSFMLSQPATVTGVTLTLYDVDDRNQPEHLKWKITTEPLGGTVLASDYAPLISLQPPYITQFLYFAWQVSFNIPSLNLPAGTYYLQIQDVTTEWDTWAFWAESSDGSAQGYYEAVSPSGDALISHVPSESFSVLGEWRDASAR